MTGGTGFLGRRVVDRLARLGYFVTSLARRAGPQAAGARIRFHSCDLRDAQATRAALAGHEYVVHCAGHPGHWGPERAFFATHVLGTQNVVASCREHAIRRLIHVSSAEVFSDGHDQLFLREGDALPARPVDPRIAAIGAAEQVVDAAARYGLPAITLRFESLFGPEDTALFSRIIAANRSTGIPWINGGKALFELTHVDNAAGAIAAALAAPSTAFGRRYHVTNGEPRPVGALLGALFERIGEPLRRRAMSLQGGRALARAVEWSHRVWRRGEPLLTRRELNALAFTRTLSIAAARRELGYSPVISLDEGLDQFARGWRSHRVLRVA